MLKFGRAAVNRKPVLVDPVFQTVQLPSAVWFFLNVTKTIKNDLKCSKKILQMTFVNPKIWFPLKYDFLRKPACMLSDLAACLANLYKNAMKYVYLNDERFNLKSV